MFTKLEAWFNTFFLGYAARVSGDLAVGLVPIALLLVTIYVAVYGLAVMCGEASEPVGTFAWKMVKVGAILSFALPGLYYSGNVVAWATGLQDGLATLFVAPRAAAATTAFGALDLANTQANEQLALLWKDAGMFRLDLVLAAAIFSIGVAGGMETAEAPWRAMGYASLHYKSLHLLGIAEYGGSGLWYKAVATYDVGPVSLGAMAQRFDGVGPRIGANYAHFELWAAPLYDFESASACGLVGLNWTPPLK